jgi:hypothetical protein
MLPRLLCLLRRARQPGGWSPWTDRIRLQPTAQPDAGVILDGHATSVPVTAVLTGRQRTTTDNAEAALTCAKSHLRR